MMHGFIKTAAASLPLKVADPIYNAKQIVRTVKEAHRVGVRFLVLPELCVTGYTCGDLFFQRTLLSSAENSLSEILAETAQLDIVYAVGMPVAVEGCLYNCAVCVYRGEVLGVVPKTHLPNYNEFYEKRHFESFTGGNRQVLLCGRSVPFGTRLLFCCSDVKEWIFALEICEDLWVAHSPSSDHAAAGAVMIGNLSASNETVGKQEYRRMLVCSESAKSVCGYVFAGAGPDESTTDLVFGGHCMVAENGVMLAEQVPFSGRQMVVSEIDVQRLFDERVRLHANMSVDPLPDYQRVFFSMPVKKTTLTRLIDPHPFVPDDSALLRQRCKQVFDILSYGLRKRIVHTGASTLVLGISGGLDSCLALLVCVRAAALVGMDRRSILCVTMPCYGTSARTKRNAAALCGELGVTLREISILDAVQCHFRDIGREATDYGAVFENSQARERTQVLMDLANQTGGLVVGTGDLSELALGWATYNGDHMSMYGVNASVPKTLVRQLVAYEADSCGREALAAVLRDILDTPVSPELLPLKDGEMAQRTEDLVGPYELHDFFLYQFVRCQFTPEKIERLAVYAFNNKYPLDVIHQWLGTFFRRFFSQQFKRSCLPDGPKAGSVALSPRGDFRMPSDAVAEAFTVFFNRNDGQDKERGAQ